MTAVGLLEEGVFTNKSIIPYGVETSLLINKSLLVNFFY